MGRTADTADTADTAAAAGTGAARTGRRAPSASGRSRSTSTTSCASIRPLDPIELQLLDAQGCVLVEDVTVPAALPPFDNSSMDGYAVRVADIARRHRAVPGRR